MRRKPSSALNEHNWKFKLCRVRSPIQNTKTNIFCITYVISNAYF